MEDITTVETTGGEVSEETAPIEETVNPAQEGEPETEQETEGAETDPIKLDAQNRIQQLIGERNADRQQVAALEAKLRELETQFQQVATPQKPDFVEITPQVERQINETLAEIENRRVEAELQGDYIRAAKHMREKEEVFQFLAKNEQARVDYERKQAETQQQSKMVNEINARAEFFRQVNNIPPEAWQHASNWFAQACQTNPVVGARFREIATYQGPMAAVEYAAWYVNENMAKPAQAAIKAKEEAKAQQPQMSGTSASPTGQEHNILKGLRNKAAASRSSEDWANYFAAKRNMRK